MIFESVCDSGVHAMDTVDPMYSDNFLRGKLSVDPSPRNVFRKALGIQLSVNLQIVVVGPSDLEQFCGKSIA